MGLSNHAREQSAIRLGSNVPNLGSPYLAIGSGSGTLTVNTTGLLNYFDRNQVTGGSVDFTTNQELTMTFDFNSSELSGLTLGQFGVFIEDSGGKAWSVQNVQNQTFDGNQELQVQVTYRQK